jgi:transcriptional regulator
MQIFVLDPGLEHQPIAPQSPRRPRFLLTINIKQPRLAMGKCRPGSAPVLTDSKADVLQGTLDLMVLKTLEALGPLHGYGLARRIEQVSENLLHMNQGTLYPALLRLQQKGWIASAWGVSENNRKARFYTLTATGKKQLAIEARNWERISRVMGRLLNGLQEA